MPESNARAAVRSTIYMLFVVAPIAAFEPRFLIPLVLAVVVQIGALCVFSSPAIGAWFIWATVRWVNRRDDPQHVELPSDPP